MTTRLRLCSSFIKAFFATLLFALLLPGAAWATNGNLTQDANGTYQITDAADLRAFAEKVNSGETTADAILLKDINLQSQAWTPIGNTTNAYNGTFDGDGHTVSRLFVGGNTNDNVGFFGYVGKNGIVQDLTVSGTVGASEEDASVGGVVGWNKGTVTKCISAVSVTGYTADDIYVGGVVGQNDMGGDVEGCSNTGTVTGWGKKNYIGGIVGYNWWLVKNCNNTGKTIGYGEDVYIGGIVGHNFIGTVKNCTNNGGVTDTNSSFDPNRSTNALAGGVVGMNNGDATVTNCANNGWVSFRGDHAIVGGVVGYNLTSITNCYNTGSVSGSNQSSSYVGGVVGFNSTNNTIANCYNTGKVDGRGYSAVVGGVAGMNRGVLDTCYNTGILVPGGDGSGSEVGGLVGTSNRSGYTTNCYYLLQDGLSASSESVADQFSLCEKFVGNEGWSIHPVLCRPVLDANLELPLSTPESPYELSTAEQLTVFRLVVDSGNADICAKLTDDIMLDNSEKWTPIGSRYHFEGIFDGNGHTISGLYIDSRNSIVGFFGSVGPNGIVKNLAVEGTVTSTNSSAGVGGVVGENKGTIENCSNRSDVKSSGNNAYVGGIVGHNDGGTVKNCQNTNTVTYRGFSVGGIVGRNDATVENCYNSGEINVTSSNARVGGVAGDNYSGDVINCYYLNGTANKGVGNGKDTTEVKTVDQFRSGEVTKLLGTAWGQNLSDENSWPTLVALDPENALKVYQLTFDWDYEGAPDETTTTVNVYTNGKVTIPGNDVIPSRDGYSIAAWYDNETLVGDPLTTETSVTDDTIYYAQWIQNPVIRSVTIIVSPTEGGTVTGGGRYKAGETVNLNAAPNDGYQFVRWEVMNDGVIIDENGSFTMPAEDVTVTAIFTEETIGVDSITVAPQEVTLNPGQTTTLTANLQPENATDKSVIWMSEDEDIATVDNGTITAVAEGTTTITATTANGLTATCTVTVEKAEEPAPEPEPTPDPDEPEPTPTPDPDPSEPNEPEDPSVDVSTDDSEVATVTTAKPEVSTENGSVSATVSDDMGAEIVNQAIDNDSTSVVIAPEMEEDVTNTTVTLPADTVESIGTDTNANIVISTPVADVTLPNGGLSDLASTGGDITVSASVKGDTVTLAVQAGGDTITNVPGGVILVVPATAITNGTVAVIIHEDGTREVVRKSVADADSVIIPLDGSATIEIVDNSKDFADVSADAWYSDVVDFASSHELFNGTSATEFSPDAGMTRGMLAAVLSNLERVDGSGLTPALDDVDENAWYADAVAWAADNGIINGYGNNTFGPDDLITREQMAAMLYNYAEMLGYDTSARADLNSYSDSASVSSWAEDVMSWANAEGLISGTSATTLDPQGTATRAQVAAMLERFVIMLAE